MKKIWIKTLLLCGVILLTFLAAASAFFALRKEEKRPAPEDLLAEAESRAEQNICLYALLEQDPAQREYWTLLLDNLEAEGADPLTFESVRKAANAHGVDRAAGEIAEPDLQFPQNCSPSEGLVAGARLLHEFPQANGVAGDDRIYYLTEDKGITAHFRQCARFLLPVRAARLTAAENGVYFLNLTEKRVQYVSADGGIVRTLSPIPATDYAFFNGKLYVAGTDGVLYANSEPQALPAEVRQLAVCGNRLFALLAGSLWCCDPALIPPTDAEQISGSEDGKLYYVNDSSLPCVYDPEAGEAEILSEKPCYSIEERDGAVYVFYNKVQKIR